MERVKLADPHLPHEIVAAGDRALPRLTDATHLVQIAFALVLLRVGVELLHQVAQLTRGSAGAGSAKVRRAADEAGPRSGRTPRAPTPRAPHSRTRAQSGGRTDPHGDCSSSGGTDCPSSRALPRNGGGGGGGGVL